MPRRPPCPQFGRLPKATADLKALNFKRTTPGDSSNLSNFNFATKIHPHQILDPAHPGAKLDRRTLAKVLPLQRHEHITIRMAPHGLLNKSFPPADEAFAYNTKEKPGKLNVSLLQIVNVKGIHKSAVIRSTIRYRVKTAFAMITTRGADVVRNKEGVEEIILRDEDIGRHWIIPNWAYIAAPTLELYRMPYTQMIPILRRMLERLNGEAAALEQRWGQQRIQGFNSTQVPSSGNDRRRDKDVQKLQPSRDTKKRTTQESPRSTSSTRMKKRTSASPGAEVLKS